MEIGGCMKKISLNKTYKVENASNCVMNEYDFRDKDIDFCVGFVKGRYPEKDFCVNEGGKELVYVLRGSGELVFENKIIKFKQGDAILIDKGGKYYWGGCTDCDISISCAPAWSPEQHKLTK